MIGLPVEAITMISATEDISRMKDGNRELSAEEREVLIDGLSGYFKEILNDRFTVVGAYKESLDRFKKHELGGFYETLAGMGAYDIEVFGEFNLKYRFASDPGVELARLCGIEKEIQEKINAAAGKEIFPSKKFNGVVLREILKHGLFVNKTGSIKRLAGIDEKNYSASELIALYRHNMERNTLNAIERIAGGFNNSYVDSFLISDLAVLRDAILDYFRRRYGTSVYDINALPVVNDADHPLHVPNIIMNMYDNDLLSEHSANRDITAISGNVLTIAQDIGMIQEVSDLIESMGKENSRKYLDRIFERVSRQVQEKYFSYTDRPAHLAAVEINNLGENIFTLSDSPILNGYGENVAGQVRQYMKKNSLSLPVTLVDLACDSLRDVSYGEIIEGKYMERLLSDFGVLDAVKREYEKMKVQETRQSER